MSERKHFHFSKNLLRILSFGTGMRIVIASLFFATLAFACNQKAKEYDAQTLVDEAIRQHGDFKYKSVSFEFRDKEYSVTRDDSGYTYTRSWTDDSLGTVMDILVNSRQFARRINGEKVPVTEEWVTKYTESVNSVLYFFQLPYVLNDPGAIKKYMGEQKIKGQLYLAVQVTFQQEGGGKDFEDVFMYWIHAENKTVDFLAYSYLTEGGGVRFREAINRREIKGLLIQDYVNHKAPKDTPLEKLPALFESGQLENLSLITNENVRVTLVK